MNTHKPDQAAIIEYHRESGWRITRSKRVHVIAASMRCPKGSSHVLMKLWRGKGEKPHSFYRYPTLDRAVDDFERLVKAEQTKIADRAAAKKARRSFKASDHWAVGDVGTYSWGYEQTNIEYYEVVEVKAKTIVIRRIARAAAEDGWLQGTCQPKRGHYIGEPQRKVVRDGGWVSMDFGGLHKWDGKADRWTAYH